MTRRTRAILRVALAVVMVAAGAAHFARPAVFVALIPPSWPLRLAAVYISGVAEVVLGALLVVERTRRLAAWGVIALLVAVFPANLYHALSGGLTDPALPAMMADPVAAWIRLPFQAVFIAWAWTCTRPAPPAAAD